MEIDGNLEFLTSSPITFLVQWSVSTCARNVKIVDITCTDRVLQGYSRVFETYQLAAED